MKKYIKSSKSDSGKYIGGKLEDIVDKYGYPGDSDETEQIWENRYEAQDRCVNKLTTGYLIIYRPGSDSYKFQLSDNYEGLLNEISQTMAIKEGIDVVDLGNAVKLIGYYGLHEDTIYLYPININKSIELGNLIDTGDFDESTIIENEIAQETWNGASVEDVLKSWK